MRKFLLLLVMVLALGCTSNVMVKTFGGKATLQLPKGQKLMNATWKETSFWYLTRPMRSDEKPETYLFKEVSSFGLTEGEFTIIESK